MGKIIFGKTGDTESVDDGSDIIQSCKKQGVPFGCKSGCCGTCEITVKNGQENLNAMTESEKEFFTPSENKRLACQVKLLYGEVEIE